MPKCINEHEEKLWAERRLEDRPEFWRKPGQIATALKAIRKKCLDCCCGQAAEVRRCTVVGCYLWPLRFGIGTHSKRFKKAHDSAQE